MNAKKLFDHWAEARKSLLDGLDKVNDSQLHFAPREGLWSLGMIALHIASAENGWFCYVVQKKYEKWPQDYMLEDYPTVAAVKALLTQVHNETEAYLESLTEADLDCVVEAPWGDHLLMRWIVWHVLEHEIHHRGEIFLLLGLLGMEAPEI
jgi:uncharacterized damage-inducible protein DinB